MNEPQHSVELLTADDWQDYALLDSGDGMRLERFGGYTLARPDPEVLWRRRLSDADWAQADATFQHGSTQSSLPLAGGTEGGRGAEIEDRRGQARWTKQRPIPAQWPMRYRGLTFHARLTPFKHTGVFPEQAVLWNWMHATLLKAARETNVLTLFGYTGLAALTCASAGAQVTYVDASRWATEWARENQRASGLAEKPIRWLVDDALKFVRREARRGVRYDAIVLDPPSFGRGPKGELWKFAEGIQPLLEACVALLSRQPLFVLITAFALDVSALTLANVLSETMGARGSVRAGELTLVEKSGGRQLSTAIVTRWCP